MHPIFEESLDDLHGSQLLRTRRAVRVLDAVHVEYQDRRLVNFASNNYLGLTHHPRVIEAVKRSLDTTGAGSGAAGLITGYTDVHASAEDSLARWKGTEAAVILPSGYQANHAVVQTIAGVAAQRERPVRFLVDKLVHASLVDAVRSTALTAGRSTALTAGRSTALTAGRSTALTAGRPTGLTAGRGSGAAFRVFPHNGLAKLRRLLEEAGDDAGTLDVVITESIFSMDGDAADLPGLAALKREHPFLLVLDEAHAAGVYGPDGGGLAAELGLQSSVDVSIATLSKAIGCVGGAVCASGAFCQALINFGRAYMFSTSVPPFVAAAAEAALDVMRNEPARQQRVRALARTVRAALSATDGDSPIVPIVLGDESAALSAAEGLHDEGMLVSAIRPPTVPRGTSRLRVTLSCEHSDAEVEQLLRSLKTLRDRSRPTRNEKQATPSAPD